MVNQKPIGVCKIAVYQKAVGAPRPHDKAGSHGSNPVLESATTHDTNIHTGVGAYTLLVVSISERADHEGPSDLGLRKTGGCQEAKRQDLARIHSYEVPRRRGLTQESPNESAVIYFKNIFAAHAPLHHPNQVDRPGHPGCEGLADASGGCREAG